VRSRRKRETCRCRGIGECCSGNNAEDHCSFRIFRKFSLGLRACFARLFSWNRALPPILFRTRAFSLRSNSLRMGRCTRRAISWIFPTDFRDDVLRSVPRFYILCSVKAFSLLRMLCLTRGIPRAILQRALLADEARGGESIDYRCLLLRSLARSAIELDKGSHVNLSYVKMNC